MDDIYYDYVSYWKKEGTLSKRDSLSFQLTREHTAQESPLINEIKQINPKSILEIGAGWGRVARLVRNNGITCPYTAIDISYDRLKQIDDSTITRKVIDFVDFDPDEYDLILAVELLMHIPPDILEDFVEKMKYHARWIITVDYDPEDPRDIKLADHNFLHEYDKLLPNAIKTQINYVQKLRVWNGS